MNSECKGPEVGPCLSCLKNSKAASVVAAEWGRVKEEEIRTKKEWGAGGKSWEATWNIGSGNPWLYADMFFHSSRT